MLHSSTFLIIYQWLQGATSSIPREEIGNRQVAVPLIISHIIGHLALVKARTPCHPVVNGTSFGGISAFYNALVGYYYSTVWWILAPTKSTVG